MYCTAYKLDCCNVFYVGLSSKRNHVVQNSTTSLLLGRLYYCCFMGIILCPMQGAGHVRIKP